MHTEIDVLWYDKKTAFLYACPEIPFEVHDGFPKNFGQKLARQ